MFAAERRKLILSLINDQGSVKVTELIEKFNISNMTALRDLKILEDKGLMKKVYGGAISLEKIITQEPSIEEKATKSVKEKNLIAKYAAENFIEDSDIIIFSGGSTVWNMIPYITQKNLTILTNGLNTINLAVKYLSKDQYKLLLCSGGKLRTRSLTFVGKEAENFFKNFKAKTLFVSGSGFSLDDGLMDPDLEETGIKKAMKQGATKLVLLLDSSKINQKFLSITFDLKQIDALITDKDTPKSIIDTLGDLNIDVRIA